MIFTLFGNFLTTVFTLRERQTDYTFENPVTARVPQNNHTTDADETESFYLFIFANKLLLNQTPDSV